MMDSNRLSENRGVPSGVNKPSDTTKGTNHNTSPYPTILRHAGLEASGSILTFESDNRFPRTRRFASLGNGKRK